jgi:hypothetical protein
MENNIFILMISAFFWFSVALFIFLKTKNDQTPSFEPTDPESMVEETPPSKFTDQCTLLSKECRGPDLWIIFVDENAQLHEELHSENCQVCVNRA